MKMFCDVFAVSVLAYHLSAGVPLTGHGKWSSCHNLEQTHTHTLAHTLGDWCSFHQIKWHEAEQQIQIQNTFHNILFHPFGRWNVFSMHEFILCCKVKINIIIPIISLVYWQSSLAVFVESTLLSHVCTCIQVLTNSIMTLTLTHCKVFSVGDRGQNLVNFSQS